MKRPRSDSLVGKETSRRRVVRFEKRPRECTYMASLTREPGKAQGNRYGRSIARATVFKRGEPRGYDPKPGDLYTGRVKRGESHVEAR